MSDKPEIIDKWGFPDVEPLYPHCGNEDEVFYVPPTVDNFAYLIRKHNELVKWVLESREE